MKKRTIWIIVVAVIIVIALWYFTRKKTIADLVYEGKNIPAPNKDQILTEKDQQELIAAKIQQILNHDSYAKWRAATANSITAARLEELKRMKGDVFGVQYFVKEQNNGDLSRLIASRTLDFARQLAIKELINQGYNITLK